MEHKSESSLRKSFEKGFDLYCRGQDELAADCLMKIEAEYKRAKLILALIENKRTVKTGYSIEINTKLEILGGLLNEDPISIYEDGLYKLARGHYEAAVKCFEKVIEKAIKAGKPGDACAQYRLGLCHAQGKGVEGAKKDLVKAAEYFHAAAVQGHEQATFYLSLCCLENEKIAKQYNPWFGAVVSGGQANQHAQYYVGICNWMGKGAHPSYEEAVMLLLPICATGHVLALYYVAISYYNESSLAACKFPDFSGENNHLRSRDEKAYFLAERYARLAALKGHSDAQYTLGMFLLEGVGKKPDFKEACEWLGKAASQGHEEAQNCLDAFAAEHKAGFTLPAVKGSPEYYKVNAMTGEFAKQAKHLREKLFAKQEHIKEYLDKMFIFDISKPVSPVSRTSPPVKSTSPQLLAENKTEREDKSIHALPTLPAFEVEVVVDAVLSNTANNSLAPMPEFKAVQEPQKSPDVNFETIPVSPVSSVPEPQESLAQKENPKEIVAAVPVSTSQVTPPDSPPSLVAESKLEPKRKKEKKPKQRADSVNDKKRESTPALSLDEAQGLFNKVILNKTLDANEKEQLGQWFGTESAIKDNENANSHYCLGLYWGYVEKNPLQAFLCYEKAVKLNSTHAGANYHLGLCYGENGKNFNDTNKPMPKNLQKALEHYQIAADNGHERAGLACERLQKKINEKQKKKEAQKEAQVASLAQEITPPVTISPSPTQEAMSDEVSLTPLKIEPHPPLESPPNTPVNSRAEAKSSGDESVSPPSDQGDKAPKDSKRLPKSPLKMSKRLFKEGKKAYGLGQYAKAKAKLKEAADASNLLACLYYGVVLKQTEPDNPEAEVYFKKAEGRHAWFLEQLNKVDEVDQLEEAEAQKVFDNLFYVGLYCEFVLKESTKERAFEYYEKAAEEGCVVEAQNYLGKHYFAKRDYNKAAYWFAKSSIKMDPEGFYHLGLIYLNGWGDVAHDHDDVLDCFSKAAAEGHVFAQYQLGLLHLETNYEINKEASELFASSVAGGCLEAACSLAECYWYGLSVDKVDYSEAKKLLAMVAAHGQKGKKLLDELRMKPLMTLKQRSLRDYIVQLQKDISIVQGSIPNSQNLNGDGYKSSSSSTSSSSSLMLPTKELKKEENHVTPESKHSTDKQEIDAFLEKGIRLFEAMDNPSAEELLRQSHEIARFFPDQKMDPKILFGMGERDYELGRYKEALIHFVQANANAIMAGDALGYPAANIYLGMMFEKGEGVKQKSPDKAGEYYEKARKAQEGTAWFSNLDRTFYLGLYTQFALKDAKQASEYYQATIKKGQNKQMLGRAQYYLGNYYHSVGTYEISFKSYKQAEQNGNPMALYQKGFAASVHYLSVYQSPNISPILLAPLLQDIDCLSQAAAQGHLDAQYRFAEVFYVMEMQKKEGVKRDFTKVIEHLNSAVKHGHPGAQYFLGKCRYEGNPVKDDKEAVRLFSLAEKQGNKEAQYALGKCYFEGTGVPINYQTAKELLEKAVAQGHLEASALLEKCEAKIEQEKLKLELEHKASASSETSSSVTTTEGEFDQDRFEEAMQANELEQYPTALKIFQEAAEEKYPPAYIYLGAMYENGFGVKPDPKKAEEYYEEARQYLTYFSEPGNEFYLGLFYDFARQPKDDQKAVEYYKIAADKKQHGQMQYRAQDAVGGFYLLRGENESANPWYKKADAEGNYANAQYRLGLDSESKYHTADSDELRNEYYKDATRWLKKAAEQGHVAAQYHLAQFLYELELRKEGAKNYSEVIRYLNLAVPHKHMEAERLLGTCYFYGRGVPQSYTEAKHWLGKALVQGHGGVSHILKECNTKIKEQEQPKAGGKEDKREQTAPNRPQPKVQSPALGLPHFSTINLGNAEMPSLLPELNRIMDEAQTSTASTKELVSSLNKLFRTASGQAIPTREEKVKARKAKARREKTKEDKDSQVTQATKNWDPSIFSNSSSSSSSESSDTTTVHMGPKKNAEEIPAASDSSMDSRSASSTTSSSSSSESIPRTAYGTFGS